MSEKTLVRGIILLLIFILGLFGVSGYLVYFPYAQYQIYLIYGVDNHYLSADKPTKAQLSPKFAQPFWKAFIESEALWTPTHFADYKLLMPVDHPAIRFRPKPIVINKESIPTFTLNNFNNESVLSFSPIEVEKVDLKIPNDIIFSLPIVEDFIFQVPKHKVIRDLFVKNLDLKIPEPHHLKKFYEFMKIHTPLDLLYNIYIYKLRKRIFKKNYHLFYHFNQSSLLVEVGHNTNNNLSTFELLSFYRGRLYTAKLTLDKSSPLALRVLNLYSIRMDIEPSRGVESAKKGYSLFRTLPFKKRMSTKGISLLYSAWTHEMDDQGYIKELIYFLERGKTNEVYLIDIYSYARNRWGTNFSTIKDKRDESLEVENKRIEKENKELFNQNLLDDESDLENTFKTDKEKLEYLLKKSREKKRSYTDDIFSE